MLILQGFVLTPEFRLPTRSIISSGSLKIQKHQKKTRKEKKRKEKKKRKNLLKKSEHFPTKSGAYHSAHYQYLLRTVLVNKRTYTQLALNKHFSVECAILPFKRQFHKRVKHTQTFRRQIVDELFECLTILWDWRFIG